MRIAFKTTIFIYLAWYGRTTHAAELVVSNEGPVYAVREAIAQAGQGDTITISGGIYKEHNLNIDKSITLIGINNPLIDGEGKGEILTIQASNVVVKDITFKNVGISHMKDNAAIRIIKSRHCTVEGNTLLNAYFGIYLENADSCIIRNNVVSGQAERETTSGNAIHLWYSSYIAIHHNRVSGHRDGIYLEFVENSQIQHNHSYNNLRYGLHFMFSNDNVYKKNEFVKNGAGVAVMYSKRIQMEENIFSNNEGAAAYGILLKDITDSRIERNEFKNNTTGILAEGSNRLLIKNNDLVSNGWAIKMMGSCEQLTFTGNNFVGNTFEISSSSRNVTGHLLEENFWSSYSGYDLDKDGFGDIPHRPVRLFSTLVEKVPTSIVLIRSLFIDLLELAEKVTPSLTPINLYDATPRMNTNNW